MTALKKDAITPHPIGLISCSRYIQSLQCKAMELGFLSPLSIGFLCCDVSCQMQSHFSWPIYLPDVSQWLYLTLAGTQHWAPLFSPVVLSSWAEVSTDHREDHDLPPRLGTMLGPLSTVCSLSAHHPSTHAPDTKSSWAEWEGILDVVP